MAKEPFIDKVIRFLEKLAWHFGIPPSEDSSLLNDGKRKPQNKKSNNNPKQNGNQKAVNSKDGVSNRPSNKTTNNKKDEPKNEPKKESKKNILDTVDEKNDENKEETNSKSIFGPSEIDEYLNNDVTLKDIATAKELQSIDTEHKNLPTFVGEDEERCRFNPDRIDLENFMNLFIHMIINKKEEYIIHCKNLSFTEEDYENIRGMIGKAFSIVRNKHIEYFSSYDGLSFSSKYLHDKNTGSLKGVDILIKLKPMYKNAMEDTHKMLKLSRYVKSELVKHNKISKDMSEYDVSKVLFNWVVLHTIYDNDKGDNPTKYSGYNALVKGKAVCNGYTSMYNALCRCCGIRVFGMIGICADRETGGYEYHIWTVVELKKKEMFVDSTWGRPNMSDENKQALKSQGIKMENFCNFEWFDTPYDVFVKTHNWDKEIYPI